MEARRVIGWCLACISKIHVDVMRFILTFQIQSLKEDLKSMAQQVTTLAESQHKLCAAGEDQKTRAISVANTLLRYRICLAYLGEISLMLTAANHSLAV